jgi:hypothetical protein
VPEDELRIECEAIGVRLPAETLDVVELKRELAA